MTSKIIKQAIELGFCFEKLETEGMDMQGLFIEINDFFNENMEKLPVIEDECEVTGHGNSQSVSYGDYLMTGEIVDFSAHWGKAPGEKVYHSQFLIEDKGIMKCCRLYFTVGENQFNTPEII